MNEEEKFGVLEPKELHQWMEQGRDFILIDALPREVYEKRRLPGALNACVYEVTFSDQVAALADKSQDIVLYGSSAGSRDAVTASEKLKRLGYDKVFALKGGVAGWLKAGYEIEGEDVVPPERMEETVRPENHVYMTDTEQSSIWWTGRNANRKHYGALKLTKGEIRVKDGGIDGTFEIDMRSVKNMDLEGDPLQPVLIGHLMSDDFFFVKMFSKAFFTIEGARPIKGAALSSPNFEVEGTLALRGVRAGILFPATVNRSDEGTLSVEAHFDFDRTRWNILYGSSRFFEHLGGHLVYDMISVELRIFAR
jgi:rhodanese-related sulfurtransferase/polyisoprenoid-binding protein YceI